MGHVFFYSTDNDTRTNNAPNSSSYEMFREIQSLRNFILKYLPSVRITISTPVLRIDKANANDISKAFIELVKEFRLHQELRLHLSREYKAITY